MPRIYKRKARKVIYKGTDNSFTTRLPLDPQLEEIQYTPFILPGEEYYTWHPKGQPWQYSKEKPNLTKPLSEWEEKYNDFSSRRDECYGVDELEDDWNDLVTEIEEYRDELQERLDNMPYQLQESSILNERIEELNDLIE